MRYGPKDTLSIYAMIVFRKADKTINEMLMPDIKKYDLTHTQFGVLDILYTKGSLKIGEIIEKLFTTSGNMTCVIKNMEKRGLITKKQDSCDKRAVLIELTAKGKKLIEELLPLHRENVEKAFSVLTAEDKENLITILKKFKQKNGGQQNV